MSLLCRKKPDLPRPRCKVRGMRDHMLDYATNLPQNAIKQKIQFASSNKNSDDPTSKRKREIEEELSEIRSKQGAGKNSRAAKLDEIKRLSAQIKSRKDEIRKFERDFGSEETLKSNLKELDKSMESATLRLAESRAIQEDQRKIKKRLGLFLEVRERKPPIDELEAKIKEIKDVLDSPEAQALSERYTKLQTEKDAIVGEQKEAKQSLDVLYKERNKLQKEQEEKWQAKKKLQDEFHQQRKAAAKYETEQKQKAWERNRAERERVEKERKLERAQKMLAEASDPAYLDEIRRANSLLQYFDPSFVAEKAPLQPSTNLQAQAERKVDASDIKGVKVLSKKDRDEDLFPAQKKGKKGKKHNAAATKSIFNCPPSVLEDCSYMGIDPPMSAEEVPGVVEKVKAKLDHWKADQAAQTQKVRYSRVSLIKVTNVLLY